MNKFKKCKTCGSQIAKSANSCPNCGAKQNQGVYAVCVLIIILAIVSCIFVVLNALPEIEQTTQSPSNASASNAVGISETLSTENFDFSIKSAKRDYYEVLGVPKDMHIHYRQRQIQLYSRYL